MSKEDLPAELWPRTADKPTPSQTSKTKTADHKGKTKISGRRETRSKPTLATLKEKRITYNPSAPAYQPSVYEQLAPLCIVPPIMMLMLGPDKAAECFRTAP